MRTLFLMIFMALLVASAFTAICLPESSSESPILYWAAEDSPEHREQIRLFRTWLKSNDYADIDLRLDAANKEDSKKIIQGVSGVGADLMDVSGGGAMRYFNAIGLLADVTAVAQDLRFDPSRTYPAARGEIMAEDRLGAERQYSSLHNVYAPMIYVNIGTLQSYGQSAPPNRWDVQEFEHRGHQFVVAANPPGQPRRKFYANTVDLMVLRRSFGVSEFNETQTRCTLDDPRHGEALRLLYRWQRTLFLVPTAADESSFAMDPGVGSRSARLFATGRIAMLFAGPDLFSQFREINRARVDNGDLPLDITIVEPPHLQFPNTGLWSTGVAIYAGGRNQDLAKYFLAFLASDVYNTHLVESGDPCPPNASVSSTAALATSSSDPLHDIISKAERDVRSGFRRAMNEIAIAQSYSPFVLQRIVVREDARARELFMEGQMSAEEAIRTVTERVNAEIDRAIGADEQLQQLYASRILIQRRIDERR